MLLLKRVLLCQCLTAVIAHYISGSDNHILVNKKRIEAQNYLKYVLNYYLTDDKSKLNYTRWFFSPEENIKFWSSAASRTPTYIFQNKDRSNLFRKFPQIYQALEGVSVDFFNKDDDNLDPYSALHSEEEKLVRETPTEVSKEAMWLNVLSVFSQSKTGKTNEKIGTFLYRKLGRSGLVLYLQTFQYYKWNNPIILESGVNIIGIMPGLNWATKQDRPLLVSSFWDIKGSAANESGTGLASILETVRVLMADTSFRSSHSVIFVAFDKNHDGKIGSKRFISDYLLPHVINKFGCRLQGILSLELDKYVNQLIPISDDNSAESVAALISRGTEEDRRLSESLETNLLAAGSRGLPFTFPNLNTSPENIHDLEYYSGLWNNDVGRFWFEKHTRSLPTLLITKHKTASRRKSAMEDTGENLESLTSALVETIKQLIKPRVDHQHFLEKTSQTDSTQIRNLLINFMLNMTSWQQKIEKKLTALQDTYKGQANSQTIDVYREYGDKDKHHNTSRPGLSGGHHTNQGPTAPYYVLLGNKPSSIGKLNQVIEEYYKPTNKSAGNS